MLNSNIWNDLSVCKQMIDIELDWNTRWILMLKSNPWNHLIANKWLILNRIISIKWQYLKLLIYVRTND